MEKLGDTMNNLEIEKLNNSKYEYLVLFTSYADSLADISEIVKYLQKKNCVSGELLFDLLLVNGNSFNRFVEAYYDGRSLNPDTYNIVENIDSTIKNRTKLIIKRNMKYLSNSVLTNSEKREIIMS